MIRLSDTAIRDTAQRQKRSRNLAAMHRVARCAACGGPMHTPTWGCIRPTLEA